MAIYGCLLFVRTSIILKIYGTEVNSIFQTANQLFAYLVLFESGLNAAYLFKMYQPMRSGNYKKIKSLYLGLNESLKKISLKMVITLTIGTVVFALFIDLRQVSYFKAVFIILMMGIRLIIPYYITLSKKTLLIVQEYKFLVDSTDSIINSTIVLIEIFLAAVFKVSVIYVLLIGIIVNLFSGYCYLLIIKKLCFKVLRCVAEPSFEAEDMTKDILVHQIGGLVNNNVDTVILSIFQLLEVTKYQGYNTIINYPIQYLNRVSETFRARFGLRLADGDQYIYKEFQQLMAIHIMIAMIVLPVYLEYGGMFIECWIGPSFILSRLGEFLFGALLLHRLLINPIYIIRDGCGLYKESKWFTVGQSAGNIILSLLLVKSYGIEGLLIGTIVSTYLLGAPGNYYLVYCKIFKSKIWIYIDMFFILISSSVSIWCKKEVLHFLCPYMTNTSWISLLLGCILQVLISTAVGINILVIYKKKYFYAVLKKIKRSIKNVSG